MDRLARWGPLGGVVLAGGLVAATLWRYPRLLDDPGAPLFLGGLAVGLGAAVAATCWAGRPLWSDARRTGTRWGPLVGALWIVEMAAGNLAYDQGRWTLVPYYASTVAAVAVTGLAGGLAAHRSGRFWSGPLAGAWSGLASGLVGLATMAVLALAAMPVLRADPQNLAEFRGAGDLDTAIAGDFLAGGIMHLLVVGVLAGGVLGAIGGAAGVASAPRAGVTHPA